MARHESDREDLLREATAMAERIELAIPGFDDAVVVGFRRQGGGSIYFGADPVVQFNRAGELRRAYKSGRLLKAELGRLIELTRDPGPRETVLWRRELPAEEHAQVVADLANWISRLRQAIAGDQWRVVGQVPSDVDLVGRVRTWLATLLDPPPIARRPGAE